MLSHFSHAQLFATPWTVPCQASLSMRFSCQEYWNRLPYPLPGDLPDPGIKPGSPELQADSLSSEPPGKLTYSNLFLNNITNLQLAVHFPLRNPLKRVKIDYFVSSPQMIL